MAFKLKHTGNSAFLFHGDPTEHIKSEGGTGFKDTDYREISRNVTTRRGKENNIPGTFTDTNIRERADFDIDIPTVENPTPTTEPDDIYLEGIKKRFKGVPGSVLVEADIIHPDFADQFIGDFDERDRIETSFKPDDTPPPPKKEYQGIVSGMGTASDFSAKGYSQNYDFSDNQRKSKNIIQRMRDNEAAGVMPVRKIDGQYNQGGSAGLVDTDTRNRQAEQGKVLGIINKNDFDLGQNYGMGYINKNYKDAIATARENFSTHNDPARLEQEKLAALALANKQRAVAKSGKFATPEMEQRYNESYDTLYSRMLDGDKTGGGRTGKVVTSANTSVDTGYFDD
jgi:hypothetical protein